MAGLPAPGGVDADRVLLAAKGFLTLVPVDRVPFERRTVERAVPTPGRVLLAGVATRRPVPVLLAGSGLPVGVAALQALVLGRSRSTGDRLCSTIGAVVGAASAWAALRLARPRDNRALRADSTPLPPAAYR